MKQTPDLKLITCSGWLEPPELVLFPGIGMCLPFTEMTQSQKFPLNCVCCLLLPPFSACCPEGTITSG